MSKNKDLTAIVAYDRNKGIGFEGKIPWKSSVDMEHFRKTTQGHIVIMGRKTWESLPKKPLTGRWNLVVSSSPVEKVTSSLNKVFVRRDPQRALQMARSIQSIYPDVKVFVIGGAQIYEAFKDQYTDQICTRIPLEAAVDTFYPDIPGVWSKVEHLSYTQDCHLGTLKFNHYRKK